MPRREGPNLARIVYYAYPHSDLLPIDPERDCRSLQILAQKVAAENCGDGLFRFLVVEIVEGGEGTLDGAVRVVRQARDDVQAVLDALVQVQEGLRTKGRPT